ncbi:IS200/IS605 family element transposase accessory protein TnpB [Scytonema sp. UIC 10036]|uniref:RNA-guided endonuclease InsQ/TnpB family protein n=1 Tax=Scytonema sp. UIC 10036 TaxID=2304196 RepID=UPI0012DA4D4E|nr:RNA-guided endonuclease TnpB family protein [Scytonema sp. UIC 10036]MUG96087.1 IS200/IS605 family element transposase accessory protein TnpB [Scytonema sp. UIC 10036]
MLLGFKTELKLNNQQRTELLKHCGVARHAWNWGLGLTKQILDHNKANPNEKIKFPTAIDLHKWLVALVKPECPWYYECSKSTPQESLRALCLAWKDCFEKKKGVPQFKKKGRHDSFTLEGTVKTLGSRSIQVPKIGVLKTYECLPTHCPRKKKKSPHKVPPNSFQPKSVTISREADKWFISFRFEASKPDLKLEDTWFFSEHSVVGVDLGVSNLATLSTGEIVEGAKSYKRFKDKLARLQWLNRQKVIGSANWKKAQLQIARLHRKIANIRKDTLHKLTILLAKNHSVIVIEDLNVKGMMANHKLAASIQDMGFFEFRRQLTYKCDLFGSKLVIVDRWFPSSKTCSNCGTVKKELSLKERTFNCECGLSINRDLNAAINLSHCVAGVPPVEARGVKNYSSITVS